MTNSPGLIEELSIKLILDFMQYLKKNRIYVTDVNVDFFDRISHEFITYPDLVSVNSDFTTKYTPSNESSLGSLAGMQTFTASSDSYDFDTAYRVTNILGDFKISQTNSFDLQRNSQRKVFTDRQKLLIETTLNEYLTVYNKLKGIYTTGIYSPLYAEPGWSEGTFLLSSIKSYLNDSTNIAKFPYNLEDIKRFPNR